ncbi:MAG: DNA-protecting protein DprA [Betaproteobacteria bacterium]|nr:DNA-protecting protein DprA [Betaproteobacteria bacterium]
MTHADPSKLPGFNFHALSPMREMGAYEWLWSQEGEDRKPSFKTIAGLFKQNPNALPSDLVSEEDALACAQRVLGRFEERGVRSFSMKINGVDDYPQSLRDAEYPLELLYYQGEWDLVYSPRRIAVVGTRNPSPEGIRRTRKLVSQLVKENFTIVSGLAKGVDTVAHETAIENSGETIAVIGTPLDQVYPKENAELQQAISKDYLLVSQVPVLYYASRSWQWNRAFFPERNVTMSALTQATVIVEAGETSGTLIQARAALAQKRKLFILESNFNKPSLTWPHRLAEKGAIRVRDLDDIQTALENEASSH